MVSNAYTTVDDVGQGGDTAVNPSRIPSVSVDLDSGDVPSGDVPQARRKDSGRNQDMIMRLVSWDDGDRAESRDHIIIGRATTHRRWLV